MAASYRLRVVTPERMVLDRVATELIVRTTEGEIGILAHHMQIVSPLVPHIMTVYDEEGKTVEYTVGGGFIEVKDDGVTILADSAEHASEIDVARAERARDRAVERLSSASNQESVDIARAQMALRRAENRLRLAGQDLHMSTTTHS